MRLVPPAVLLASCLACASVPAGAPPGAPGPPAGPDPEAARLVDLLGADDPFDREEAQRALEALGDRACSALVPVLDSTDAEIRWRANSVLRVLRARDRLVGVRLAFAIDEKLYSVDLDAGVPRPVADAPSCWTWTHDGRLLVGGRAGLSIVDTTARPVRGWDDALAADHLFPSPTGRFVAVVTAPADGRRYLVVVDLEDESCAVVSSTFHVDGFDPDNPPATWVDDRRLVATWRESRRVWTIARYDAIGSHMEELYRSETAQVRAVAGSGDRVAAIVRPHGDLPHALARVAGGRLRILRAETRTACLMSVTWCDDALRVEELHLRAEGDRRFVAERHLLRVDAESGSARPYETRPVHRLPGGYTPVWLHGRLALVDPHDEWLHEMPRWRPRAIGADELSGAETVRWSAWSPR